jgi:AcrR family transcriptional regulator
MEASARRGARTREAILERAVDVASLEGLEGLTIGRLATELRMSKSSLFSHFGSKEELQLAALDRATGILWHEVVEPAASVEPGLARLRALLDGYLRYLEREVFPGGCFLSAAAAEFDGRPGRVRNAIAEASGAWTARLEQQARIARGHGELPADTRPAQLAFELNAFANAANSSYQLHRDKRAFKRARTAIAQRLGHSPRRSPQRTSSSVATD